MLGPAAECHRGEHLHIPPILPLALPRPPALLSLPSATQAPSPGLAVSQALRETSDIHKFDCHPGLNGTWPWEVFHAPCCRHCLQYENYKAFTLLTLKPDNRYVCVQCFLPLEGFKSCHPTPILQSLCLQNKNLVHMVRTNSATKRRKSSADQRQRLRSRTSPQFTPNIDRPGGFLLDSWLSANLFGPFDCEQRGHRGVSPVTLDPSRIGYAVAFPPILFATTTRFRTSPRSTLGCLFIQRQRIAHFFRASPITMYRR